MISKKVWIMIAIVSILIVPLVHGIVAPANLKVIEAPQRPKYNDLPGFSEISLIASAGGIIAYYLAKRKLNKKAVSPVIATVLLVALTIALFLVIFTWSKGFIKEQVEKGEGGRLIEVACQSVSFNAVISDSKAYVTNTGNVVIYAFQVKGEKEGTSKIDFARTESGKLGVGDVDNLDIAKMANAYPKITLIPVLLGTGKNSKTGKVFACSAQAKVIRQ